MRTIATRLLPNPHCLSSHAVHRIRHGPAVRSPRCHGCARAGLRSAPAPLPTGAARLLLQRMVDPRRPRPSCRPRATAPECDAPDGSFRVAATASPGTFGSPEPPPVRGARPDPLPVLDPHQNSRGHLRRRIARGRCVRCHSRAPTGWKFRRTGCGRANPPRPGVTFSSNFATALADATKQSLAQHRLSPPKALSTRAFAARPASGAATACAPERPIPPTRAPIVQGRQHPADAVAAREIPPANTQRNGPRETKTGLMVCRSPGASRVGGYTR